MGIDYKLVDGLKMRINKNYEKVAEIMDESLADYCIELDDMMNKWKGRDFSKDKPNIDELNELATKLPAILYYIESGAERLAAKKDIAKIIKNDEYYNALLDSEEKTVDARKADAEAQVLEQTVMYSTFEHASAELKGKLSSGYELLNAVKKVITYTIADMELSRGDSSNYQKRR